MRAGHSSEVDHVFLSLNHLALSFPDISDASKLPASRAALKVALAEAPGAQKPEAIPAQAGQLFRFMHEMRIGDRIIYPRKTDRTLRWGEVTGPYIYDPSHAGDFAHRRSVRWLGKSSRDTFSQGALYELGSTLTLFEIKTFADEYLKRFESVGESAAQPEKDDTEQSVVRDIVETTKDFISRRLRTDLKGHRLELFVAELFRAMGYRAHATRSARDEGIDVIAHRDELGIEPPILKIQVKSTEGIVGPDLVKAFYAMVHERDVGVFLTSGTYSAAAVDFAKTKGNLKLVNGIGFVDLIQTNYDRMDIKYRRQIPLRRILVPDVAIDDE